MTPNDPLSAQQWHFGLIGNILRVWDDYTGRGVRVLVVDDGVQYTHPDLAANYLPDHFAFGSEVFDPTPLRRADAHGTACAGLIAAAANGLGGVGVAFGARITGLNMLEDTQNRSPEVFLASLAHGRDFDISSNSWGSVPAYLGFQNLSDPESDSGRIHAVYAGMAEEGRGGLGTVIVQAAGNEARNAQGDGVNASRFTITVAAVEQSGFVTDYSNFGSCILVAAPAASVTTDLTGNAGYNRSGISDGDPLHPDYTSAFGGTSAATPVVSGVVALMLEANPDLGWRDVQDILAASARLTGSAYGGPGAGFEQGRWTGLGNDGQWNGGDRAYHLSYGYGLVDAFAATRMAEVWHLFGPPETSANEIAQTVSASGLPLRIPASGTTGTVDVPLFVPDLVEIDHLEVTISILHTYAADLKVYLVAPDGSLVPLMLNEGGARLMDAGLTWTFGVDALRGYSSGGTWTLRVVDEVRGDSGTLSAVSLTFYGSPVSADDVHHFTDDFPTLAAVEPSRRTITDTDGGTDWLNLAAIAGDIAADLGPGGRIRVDGVLWATLAGDGADFENLVAGDGDDLIWGNALGNHIVGMRGADRIHGLGGNDLLEGGAGDDLLSGGVGDDTLRGGAGADRLAGGPGRDLLQGGAGDDRLWGGPENDRLWGEAGDDLLLGGTGNDQIFGGPGKDELRGNAGNDTLDGGPGNDTLTGGPGRDVFIFRAGGGADRITDFADNEDRLRLDPALWGGGMSAAEVVAAFATVVAGNTVLDFGGGNSLTLVGLADPEGLVDDIFII